MRNFVVYHNTAKMGADPNPRAAVTRKAFAQKTVGDRIWLIAGAGSRQIVYTLVSWFLVAEVSKPDRAEFYYRLSGTEGKEFDPQIPLNELEWFRDFLRSQRNFRSGMQLITDSEVVARFEELATGN